MDTSELRSESVLFQWNRLLFGLLEQEGVKDVVICPGSRNAPLIFAAVAQEGLSCHSVIDERSAGFLALGLARAGRRPVALVCTSGSAVAHFLPAVIEAHQSGIPLLVLSADRPGYLQGSGAPQTIVQSGIFGCYAKTTPGWLEPSAREPHLLHFAQKVRLLMEAVRGSAPGPAHLNLPFDKPLEPLPPASGAEHELHSLVDRILGSGSPWRTGEGSAGLGDSERFLDEFLGRPGHCAIALGPVEPAVADQGYELAFALGLPLFTEMPGRSDLSRSVELFARRRVQKGDGPTLRVLHLGPPFASSAWARAIESGVIEQLVVSGRPVTEPSARARQLLVGKLESLLPVLLVQARKKQEGAPSANENECDGSGPVDVDAIKHALASSGSSGEGGLSEPRTMVEVLGAAKEAKALLIGNSTSVRLAGWVAPLAPSARWQVYLTRGANGIDGLLAQACGVARGLEAPLLAIVGDVAAAHDLGALQLARELTSPLVIVVIDNAGGRIFEQLPGARLWEHQPAVAPFFLTAPKLDFVAIAGSMGMAAYQCSELEDLRRQVQQGLRRPGPTVIVARTDPSTTRSFFAALEAEEER